jgi:ferredoxin|tara:strand:+ start:1580 stop:1843 length:264 start_codon:yes stop_codon:yes gene_type:complete
MSNNFLVTIDNNQIIQHSTNNTLLDTIEENGIQIEYHCRDGYCGTCRSKLVSGEVEYVNYPLAFIGDGEILPCCCIPVSDIEIELYK